MGEPERSGAGLPQYLKQAFLFRWNLLALFGAAAAAALTPVSDVLLPLVAAAELAYLAGLVSIPRFRAAIDARHAAVSPRSGPQPARTAGLSLGRLVRGLSGEGRDRFERLRSRCLRMRTIAQGVRGRSSSPERNLEDLGGPALDRMLWVFLRLLHSRDALDHFLRATSEQELVTRVEELRAQLSAGEQGGDERIARSLRDSLATAELRLDNYRRAEQNARFVTVELDRIEQKIQALSEAAVNRQDPDFISSQVDSVAESVRRTEEAMGRLQVIGDLVEGMDQPPAILDSDLEEVLHE